MDGVIVVYHNTERMFGFQYIPLEEMDRRLFGPGPGAGDRVFSKCLEMLELVADEIILCFPKQVFVIFLSSKYLF
jgi:Mitochondrial protein Pet127